MSVGGDLSFAFLFLLARVLLAIDSAGATGVSGALGGADGVATGVAMVTGSTRMMHGGGVRRLGAAVGCGDVRCRCRRSGAVVRR